LNAAQLHSAIMTVKRVLKRKGKLWIRVFPHIPVTKKPLEVRMGKGKGPVDHWITKVAVGSVLVELQCDSPLLAKTALTSISKKLPFKTAFIHHPSKKN
jgi:large subunit ribosomal protein L16